MKKVGYRDAGDGIYLAEIDDGAPPPSWSAGMTPLTDAELAAAVTPSAAAQLAASLAALADDYKADMQTLNQNWLAAAVADGTQETAKKTAVTQAIADRKTQYIADLAAARTKFSTTS